MKLAHIAVVILAGSIGVALAASRQANTTPVPQKAPAAQPAVAAATPAAAAPDNLRHVLDMFRSDLNTAKISMLNREMKLTSAEAEKFWPIYQKYETELNGVNDRRVALIRQFVTLHATNALTNQNANELANSFLQVVQDRLNLWKKYHGEVSSALSPMRGAQFLQLEHQISLLVDINIASEMPLVNQPAK